MRPPKYGAHIHGESGMDLSDEEGRLIHNADLEQTSAKSKRTNKAVFAMHDAIATALKNDRQSSVTVVCTGCLTNMALFLTLYPEMIPRIKVCTREVSNRG